MNDDPQTKALQPIEASDEIVAGEKSTSRRVIPIRYKLLLATLLSGLIAVLIVITGLYCMHLLNQRLQEVVGVASDEVRLTHLLRQDLSAALRAEQNMLLANNEKEFNRLASTTNSTFESIDKHIVQLGIVFESENQPQLDEFLLRFSEWKDNHYKLRNFTGNDVQFKARTLSLGPGDADFDAFELTISGMAALLTTQAEARLREAVTGEKNAIANSKVKARSPASQPPTTKRSNTVASANEDGQSSTNKTTQGADVDPPLETASPNASTLKEPEASSEVVAYKPALDSVGRPNAKLLFALSSETRDKVNVLTDLRRDALKLQRAEKNLVLRSSDVTQKTPHSFRDRLEPIRKIVKTQTEIVKRKLNKEELKTFAIAESSLQKYFATNEKILEVLQQKGNKFAYIQFRDKGPSLAKSCDMLANQMVSTSEKTMDNYEKESSSLYEFFRTWLLSLSLIAVGSGVVISLWIGSSVADNVRKLHAYAKQIHLAKDLTRPVPDVSNDEIGELAVAFDEMRISLLQQNRQLATLNETLEHKNEEMEQFVYSASHDLKSPLVSCKGLVGLINEDIADGDFQEAIQSANRLAGVTDQMSNTIDDLLTFSRLGRDRLPTQPVNMNALISQLQEEWQDRLDESGVEFRVVSNLPIIQADPIAVRRVFDNLIGNAVKYAGDVPNPTINIGSKRIGSKIELFVRDNGPGIEPQYHDKIFGLFQRLDTSKTGSGIGLASVAKIMRQHRGRIWVESRPNEGATFWVKFPNFAIANESV